MLHRINPSLENFKKLRKPDNFLNTHLNSHAVMDLMRYDMTRYDKLCYDMMK